MTECYLTPAAPDLLCRCDNCGHECLAAEVGLISDIDERLDPGGLVPVGECPVCGSFTYYADGPDGTYQASAEADRRNVAAMLDALKAAEGVVHNAVDSGKPVQAILDMIRATIAAAEGNAPEPEPAPKFVYVLTIDSGRGTITSAFESEDEAQADLAKWCRECWPWPDTNPADLQDHEVIAEYFDGNDDEFATIERIQVGG